MATTKRTIDVCPRDCIRLLDMARGNTDLNPSGLVARTAFNEFKAWTISYVNNHQALDVSVPAFSYADTSWTCRKLRKSLRVFQIQARIGLRGHRQGLNFVFQVKKRWKADMGYRPQAWAPHNLDLPGTMHIKKRRLYLAVRTAALIRGVIRPIVPGLSQYPPAGLD